MSPNKPDDLDRFANDDYERGYQAGMAEGSAADKGPEPREAVNGAIWRGLIGHGLDIGQRQKIANKIGAEMDGLAESPAPEPLIDKLWALAHTGDNNDFFQFAALIRRALAGEKQP